MISLLSIDSDSHTNYCSSIFCASGPGNGCLLLLIMLLCVCGSGGPLMIWCGCLCSFYFLGMTSSSHFFMSYYCQ